MSFWLHFDLHVGVILGAKFATILVFGRPGGPNRLTKERLKTEAKKGEMSEPERNPRTPLHLPRQSHPGAPPVQSLC